MEKFNWNRFGALAKWTYYAEQKSFIKMTSILFFCLFAIFEINSIGNANTNGLVVSSIFTFFTMQIVGASLNFASMKEKEDRVTYLMIPASNLEKYIMRFLYVTLGFAISFLIALLTADVLRIIFLLISGHGICGSVFIEFFKSLFNSTIFANHVWINGQSVSQVMYPLAMFLTLCCAWFHSIYLLGGSFFRRNAWLFTTISMILGGIIFGWVVSVLPYENFNLNDHDTVAYIFSVIFIVLIIFNYYASYKLFTRMQVINNKWTNV